MSTRAGAAPAPIVACVSDYLPAIYMRVRERYPEVVGPSTRSLAPQTVPARSTTGRAGS
jgi:hypothetical protein